MCPPNENRLKVADAGSAPEVLVTGASGYVALHCVRELLDCGYRVRGTVRDKNNQKKVGPLWRLPHAKERLTLVEADLLDTTPWEKALSGCDYVLHVASPWPIIADESVIRTAVEGTLTVLRAASKCGSVKKVVLTSSCAAVNDGHKNSAGIFDETCWSNLESKHVDNYAKSKTLAEKAAWSYWKSLPEESRFDLTVLNPTLIMGPVLSDMEHGSATILSRMMNWKTYLAAPKASVGLVDVRDVARAHVAALQSKNTNSERILITSQPSVWFGDMTRWLIEEFAKQGYYISPVITPNWLLKTYAMLGIDKQVDAVLHRIGPELKFNNEKSIRLLNMTYITPHQSIIDMMYSMIDHGMVKKTKKYCNRQAELHNLTAQ